MDGVIMYSKDQITKKLIPVNDSYLRSLKDQWFQGRHPAIDQREFINKANEWFRSTKINDIQGWDQFTCVDVIMGCTHYIESFILKNGWEGMQILPDEYGYYGMMGKFGNEIGNLEPNIPLIVSLPNFKYADIRPCWEELLKECEQKNIDIHIDFAWITTARDIQIDVGHPNIKSFAMSMSKYAMQWNRIGLRWSRQRTMDSITIFNHYYGDVNNALMRCGAYMIENLPRDYGWNTYKSKHFDICTQLGLESTKLLHVAREPGQEYPVGIGNIISD